MRSLGGRIDNLELSRLHPTHAARWAALCSSLCILDCSVRDLAQPLPHWRPLPNLERLELHTVDPRHPNESLREADLHQPAWCHRLQLADARRLRRLCHMVQRQLQNVKLRKMTPRLCSNTVTSCLNARVIYAKQ